MARYSPILGELKETRPPICAICDGKGYPVLAMPNTITS